MTALAADFRDTGWPDLYVASDSTPSLRFRNNRDGTFSEAGLASGAALSEDGMEQAGVEELESATTISTDGSTSSNPFAGDTSSLYRKGEGNFDDVTIRSGVGVATRYVGWGAATLDLDNDGL